MTSRAPERKFKRPHTTLVAQQLLAGQREEITMMQLRSSPGDILTQVQMGKTFVIMKNGEPIADLVPHELNALELGAAVRKLGLVEK